MTKFRLSVIALVLAPLYFAQEIGEAMTGGIVDALDTLPYGERAKSVFDRAADWTPGSFKNAVDLQEAKLLRDPQGNTILHAAVETGNIALVELLHREYGFVGTLPNREGKTAIDMAQLAGDDFAGVFGDVVPGEVKV